MEENTATIDQKKKIQAEKRRLRTLLGLKGKKGGEPKLRAAEKLVDNAAFMAVLLEGLQSEITANGCTEEYQNGENQKGVKKSAAFDAYSTTIKNYLSAVKQLTDLAPSGVTEDELSVFMRKKS